MESAAALWRTGAWTIRLRAISAGVLAVLLLASPLPAAMEIRSYTEARHDRFYTGGSPDDTLRTDAD